MSKHNPDGDIYNLMQDAVLVIDSAAWVVLQANPAAHKLSGYSANTLQGLSFSRLYPALTQPTIQMALDQHGPDLRFDENLHLQDGSVLFTQVRLNPAEFNQSPCLICVSREVAPLTRQESTLNQSAILYDSLVGVVPDLVFRIARDGTYLDFKVPNNLGIKVPLPQEIVGKKIKDIVPPYVTEKAMPAIERAITTGKVELIDYEIEEATGLHWYECRFIASVENEVIAVVTDISARKRAEAEAFENQMTMRVLLDAFPDIALLMDRNWTILTTNHALAKRYNAPIEHLIGTSALAPLPPDVAAYRRSIGEKVLSTGEPECFEDFNRDTYFFHSVYPLFNAQGIADRIAVFVRDITEQKRGKALLEQQQAILEGVAQATTHLLIETEVGLAVQTAINILGQKLGIDRVFVFKNHLHPDTRQPATTYWKEWVAPHIRSEINRPEFHNVLWDTAGLRDWHERLSHRQSVTVSGREIRQLWDEAEKYAICSLLVVPIFISDEFWGCVGFDHQHIDHEWTEADIEVLQMMATSIGAAVNHQRAKEKLYKAHVISETLRDIGMALTSTLKPDELWSSLLTQARRIVNYTAANVMSIEGEWTRMVKLDGYEAVDMPAEDVKKISFNVERSPIVQRMIQTRQYYLCADTYNDPLWIRIPGTEWIKSWLGVPIVAKGQVVGLFSMDATQPEAFDDQDVKNITAFAQQAAVAFQNALLFDDVQKLEQIKSQMIRIASHDLRTPLTRVINLCMKLEKQIPAQHPIEEANDLVAIHEAAQDMNQIIGEILSLERIEARYRKAEPLDWCKMIERSLHILRGDLQHSQHQIQVHCAPDLPVVKGNPVQLEHAILNMIQNAVKYTPPGGKIEIRAFAKSYANQPVIAVEVEDNGIGVPPEDQAKIFEPFYRARRSESDGLGIGLAVVKSAVEDHRGRVYLDSVPGEGSLFGFWIPV